MSRQSRSTALTHSTSPVTILIKNLRLLNLDKHGDWPDLSAQSFISKDHPQNQKIRIQHVEWACYRLYQIWDQDECENKLQPFFPPLEPLQSINLRAALFRCLSTLKRNGIFGKDVTIRKTMFDDCKGEKLQELLSAFSSLVLRKVLAAEKSSRNSVVGRICQVERIPYKEHVSLLPLATAHRTSLRVLLIKRASLKARIVNFRDALDKKDEDLASKFDKVVEAQGFLDKNVPSESTVSRVAKVLDQHWQGDRRLVDVIAQGEEHGLKDALLDQEFETIWPQVTGGSFNGDITASRYGILEDLERRVATQKAKLQQWRDYRNHLEQGKKLETATPSETSARKPYVSLQTPRFEERKGKDLVFSPRKSPRKSMWPFDSPTPESASDDTKETHPNQPIEEPLSKFREGENSNQTSPPQELKPRVLFQSTGNDLPTNNSYTEENDHSRFSEVSAGLLECEKADMALKHRCSLGPPQTGQPEEPSQNPPKPEVMVDGTTVNCEDKHKTKQHTEPDLEDDRLLAEKLVSLAINAGPTPVKPKPSLAERARQSMTIAGTGPTALSEASPLPLPPTGPRKGLHSKATDTNGTLAERTRHSIALVPAKPKRSGDSLARRTSKAYPTNQFETPRRPTTVHKLTPSEELFSAGAGYDSVFKSRPKIAFSPTASLSADESGALTRNEQEDSPLARLALNTSLE